jgi:hypothetical protein
VGNISQSGVSDQHIKVGYLWLNSRAMHGSLLTSSLLAESYGDVSLNIGYNFGQEDEAYSTMAFNLNGLNLNQSIIDSRGHLINSWADMMLIMNRGDLGMEECSLSKQGLHLKRTFVVQNKLSVKIRPSSWFNSKIVLFRSKTAMKGQISIAIHVYPKRTLI